LAEILVAFFRKRFREIHPTLRWEENRKSPCPQALALLVTFAALKQEGAKPDQALASWVKTVYWRLPKAPAQMFFIGSLRPESDQKEAAVSLRLYRKWGFFGKENLLGEKRRKELTLLGVKERRLLLQNLIRRRKRFTVSDYMEACDRKVHRRTAERDLRSCAGLLKNGATKSALYRARPKSKRKT
jgi:hypothetical protein